MHEQPLEEWRELRLWDTVSLSVRMPSWELRIIKLDLLPNGEGLSLMDHISAKCQISRGLKAMTPALKVGLEVFSFNQRMCIIDQ